jgi:hypothetical protein
VVFAAIGGYLIFKGFALSASNIYIAQAAAGSADGSSCTNAKAVSFFNTAGNWGTGSTQIGPGTVVHLCGTVTTSLTFQGSGTAGSPITLLFEPNAKISEPVCGDCMTMDNRNYITVDGGANGIVESNNNGTNKANHQSSTGISAEPCNNCTIKNLTVQNMYVIAPGDSFICASGCAVDNAGAKCIRYSGHDWLIDHNTFHDASWCIYEYGNGTDANNRISNNNIYNIDHGWTVTGGGPYGHVYFNNNHMHDMGAWDACDSGNNCHHDGIHCFFGPGSGASFADSYIYDNTFDGTVGTNATAWVYLESNGDSPCANSSSKWYIFNNIFTSSDQVSTNPYVTMATGTVPNKAYLYNNTFSGPGGGHYGNNGAACSDISVDFENNAVGGCAQFNGAGSGVTDFNAYAFQSAATNCWPVSGGTCNFASWQAAGHDSHGRFAPAGAVGSNTAGAGTNLTSLCTGGLAPLCSDIGGNPRPASGAWSAGAGTLSGGTTDSTPPTVSLTAPSNGATVSGTNVTLSANASDNVAVAGVQFQLDGSNLGSEDTSAPYATSWDTTQAQNGSHTLTAIARDAAGNSTTSSAITVTVTGGTNTFKIGEPNILGSADDSNGNLLLAQNTTLSQSAAIQSLSFYVTTASGSLRLGIYDATGPNGGPGALEAQTASFTPTTGWNTAATTTSPTLNPGTYWLAYLPSSDSLAFVKGTDSSSSGVLYSYAFGALPNTFSTTPSTTASHWSLYATLNLSSGTGPKQGDLNGDSAVNILDLSILLSNYGTSNAIADINHDSTVNIFDLSILLSNYGT